MALPAGTIFPTEHVADLIAAAQAGEHILSRQVFDGSGEDALTKATAVIGAGKKSALPSGGGEELRWPVSIAYFAMDGDDTLPQFEIAFDSVGGRRAEQCAARLWRVHAEGQSGEARDLRAAGLPLSRLRRAAPGPDRAASGPLVAIATAAR